ncbi:helix-turn-helix domain-containing protein [Laribacter hongkongensis]|uniref:helix-turn-helix domain-containing protein n=1 Tax=Laribacter hongkongensis TaxID=168471 RepID=UPI001EFC7990|nr:helix-turn-helix transcriptional regulator [Laribacter hongkongensis]MCG9005128.1 helix-turn-helix domain-containing protein [Laribacter hongkongensis]MCG9045100.1 helix-turn-helix domain-containing protein [Laribacter hongkongensis]MCG9061184.1 helix-turn-helix domain-containing protein [Laribacter hongkongensis]
MKEIIGERLRLEKVRLGLSQRDMAALGAVSQGAYHYYEAGKRCPDAEFLLGLSKGGVDIWFVLFGTPAPDGLSADEALLLMDYRSLSPQEKFQASVAVRQLGLSSNNPPPAVHDAPAPTPSDAARAALEQAGVKIKGDAGNINTGPVDQSNMTMIVGRRTRVIKRDDKK